MSCRTNQVGQSGVGISNVTPTPDAWSSFSKVTKLTNNLTDIAFYWSMNSNYAVGDTVKLRNPQVIDLTQMFGSTIADHLYALETASAGSGIAKLKSWGFFTKDYYEYNAGELMSVSGLQSRDTVGFNVWDEEWEVGTIIDGVSASLITSLRSKNFIPVMPNNSYYIAYPAATIGQNTANYIHYYDVNKEWLSVVNTTSFVVPENARYIKFVVSYYIQNFTVYNNDICINISDPLKNGTYEPYARHTYPLDSTLTLRGIPKLDADNNLYYEGDEYASDGSVKRKYAVVDLGSLTWAQTQTATDYTGRTVYYSSANSNISFRKTASNKLKHAFMTVGEQLLAKSISGLDVEKFSYTLDNNIAGTVWALFIDSSKTAAQVKEFFKNQYLVVEVASPTVETADPYANPQVVSPEGTEEYVTTSIVPVGHITKYPDNLRKRLNNLPDTLALKADIDGTYEDLTVGTADGVISKNTITESVPYLFRNTGGDAGVVSRLKDKIVGGTIVWNQLFQFENDSWTNNGCSVTVTNGRFVLSGTASTTATSSLFPARIYNSLKLVTGHKYFIGFVGDYSFENIRFVAYGQGGQVGISMNKTSQIFNMTLSNNTDAEFISTFTSGQTYTADFKSYFVDLTKMFGSTIADYVYNLEQATAGAGVAWFKKLFPNSYYPYNAGELISVSGLQSHDTVGSNLWDEEWEHCYYNQTGKIASSSYIGCKNLMPVIPGKRYYTTIVNKPLINVYAWGYSDTNYHDGKSITVTRPFTIPEGVNYIGWAVSVGSTEYDSTTYNHDIYIKFADSFVDQYEPYKKHSYPLDSSLTLRGIPKLDSNNKLYYDGDTYEGDGTVTRRYGVVDLGTLDWTYTTVPTVPQFRATLGELMPVTGISIYNAICTKYPMTSYYDMNTVGNDKLASVFYASVSGINVIDSSYTDAATFKTAMSGVMLVYEIPTQTIEQAEPFKEQQICDPSGTEEYVTTSIVPVGHETVYHEDIINKIDGLPWNLSMIAPIDNGTTATRAYSTGQYFMHNNQFCKAKTSIASGATFTLNTNYEVTTVATELYNALNS